MSLADLSERLDQRFQLLTGGSRTALPRQRTLQATFDWSFQLLSAAEQAVLTRLSVFPASFDLEAAEAVCSTDPVGTSVVADLLGSLVNKNLVVPEPASVSLRYSVLETVRQYGTERLSGAGGEAELGRARAAHAQHYVQLAERAEPFILGGDQARWLKTLDLDWDNLRGAFDYFLAQPGRAEEVLRMGAALANFLWSRHHPYGLDAVRTALARPDPVPARVRAKALCYVGASVANTLGWATEEAQHAAKDMMQQGLEMARQLGDEAMMSAVLADLASAEEFIGDPVKGVRYAEEALEIARRLNSDWLLGHALGNLALAVPEGAKKKPLFTESIALMRRTGDLLNCCWCYCELASLEVADENWEAAIALLEEDLVICEELGGSEFFPAWFLLGETRMLQGRFEEAAAWLRRSMIFRRRLGERPDDAFPNLICCIARLGHFSAAARLDGAYDAASAESGRPYEDGPQMANSLAHLAFLRQKFRGEAREYTREALGDDEYQRLYDTGSKLTLDEALDLASHEAAPAQH